MDSWFVAICFGPCQQLNHRLSFPVHVGWRTISRPLNVVEKHRSRQIEEGSNAKNKREEGKGEEIEVAFGGS